jgi:NAD(P)H dehydrogenase (quinone)
LKHAVIVAHPNPQSLTGACARAYAETARGLGHQVVERDLYRMGFDPCLKAEEIPGPKGAAFAADVLAERKVLQDVDVFALVYPLWFNAQPAILKGYVDRVFSLGFGYAPEPGGTGPRLTGKQLISFTTSGAPEAWVRDTGALRALTTLFDAHLAGVCGVTVVDHIHSGGVVPGITPEAGDAILDAVRAAVRRHFSDQT